MPFCRKCGRRLVEYSESCPDCGTSTTSPIIKVKKLNKNSPSVLLIKPVGLKKVTKASIPFVSTITVKEIQPIKAYKPQKPAAPPKLVAPQKQVLAKPAATPKPAFAEPKKAVVPAVVYPITEIKISNVSLSDDYAANPHDYETQAFDYNLKCIKGHFFGEGKLLPLSKGKAFCPKCGEKLRKPKRKQRQNLGRTFA